MQPINATTLDYLREIRFRHQTLCHLYFQRFTKEMPVTDNALTQYTLVRNLIQRGRKFGDKAEMTALEVSQVHQFANWLIERWHDFHGSANRPQMVLTDSGAGWVHSKSQL